MTKIEIFNVLKTSIPNIVREITKHLSGDDSIQPHENFIKKMKIKDENKITMFALYLGIFQGEVFSNQLSCSITNQKFHEDEKGKNLLLRLIVLIVLLSILIEREKTVISIPTNMIIKGTRFSYISNLVGDLVKSINNEILSHNNKFDQPIRLGDILKEYFSEILFFIISNEIVLDYEKIPDMLKDTCWVIKK